MTREERCQLAIERGYKYDSESGLIYNSYGKLVKHKNNKGYINISLQTKDKFYILQGHQFAWYWVYKECVEQLDHINRIKDDNRICNLRPTNSAANQWNRGNVKGYLFVKDRQRYKAEIRVNNKKIFLGYFKTEEEARQAYLNAKEKFHVILN